MMTSSGVEENIQLLVQCFRQGRDAEANAALVSVMDHVLAVLETDAQKLGDNDVNFVNALVQAQANSDYLYVADLMEFVFPQITLSTLL